MPDPASGPLALLRALADDDRLRVVGMLALRPRDPADIALLLGITEAALERHLRILSSAGLVRRTGGICSLDTHPLREVMAATAERKPVSEMVPDGATAEQRKVLAAFFDGVRLISLPTQRKKMLIVLGRLIDEFDPDRTYLEREVNDILRRHHDDVAALRRAMVDFALFHREKGRYRRLR